MFSELSTEETCMLTLESTCRTYKRGDTIFKIGARPTGVYCIHEGKVKVARMGSDGKEQIVGIFKEGDLLGYRTLLSEDRYAVSAVTLEDSKICFLPGKEFLQLLKKNLSFHEKITRELCKELSDMTESLTILAQKSVRQRLASTLISLNDIYKSNGAPDGSVSINLSREDLANMVGTATETLIRILHDFKEDAMINTAGRKIWVTDVNGLKSVADNGIPLSIKNI